MSKPPKSAEPAPRRYGVREVGALLPEVGGMAFRRFGFVQAALLQRWREVVGPVYARWSVPENLKYPRNQKSGGTLTVRVEGPFALQFQHLSPQIIERANRILGHNAIARLKLVHGEVPRPAVRDAPPQAEAPAAVSGNLAGVKDEKLRDALEDLAAQLALRNGPPKVG